MNRVLGEESAGRRARWLAELAEALEDARQVTKRLGSASNPIDTIELYARIEAARLEVETIRLRRMGVALPDFHPEWTDNFPWKRSA